MLLTKLELKGFKSFADKVVINFDEGITGIVGPNGCGKSNVVDAIRWVLGEQKIKSLRSEKMENIIFNGTKSRKQTQLAEVSLTFDNTKNLLPTEYSTVTITRRYFRSGESEYQLNGVTCRLKDITSLFLDTGIGSDSYAIIELKMIDDILNDKDNSRRGLFEEAAGVSKFKIRKKQTLKKLSDTDADLERVEDLLFEIEKNLRSLEKQAKQAERYYKLKEDYKRLSIALARKSIEKHTSSFQQLNKTIEEENDRKISLNTQLNEKNAGLEQTKTGLIEKEKSLASQQKELNDYVAKIRNYESDKQIKNERLKFLNDKADNLSEQIDHDKKNWEQTNQSIKLLDQNNESLEQQFKANEQELQHFRSAYDQQKEVTGNLQNAVNQTAQDYRTKQDQVYQLNKDIEIKEIQIQTLQQELDKASSDTSEKTASLAMFDSKVEEVSLQLSSEKAQLQKLKDFESNLHQSIEIAEGNIEVVRDQLVQHSRQLDAKQNEYNLTKSLVENLEGFPEAIKFLKKNAHWGKKAPLLSDIITCDDQYRITVENYLEPYMNYYVVDTAAQAYEAINLLNEAAKGKANFFILDSFERFHPSDSKIFDNATAATEIVEYESKYRKLVGHILDAVYIVDGDFHSIPQDDDCVFITKNGSAIKKKYSMAGGSVGLFEGKRIGRAKNLDKLQKDIRTLDKKIEKIKKELEEEQNQLLELKQSSKKSEIETLQHLINLVNEEFVSIKTKQEQFIELISSNKTKKEDILATVEKLQSEVDTGRPKAEEEATLLLEFEKKISQSNEQLVVENDALGEKSNAFNQKNLIFHQLQNKIASLGQELSYKQTSRDSLAARIEKNQVELKNNESEIKALLDTAELNEEELLAMYETKEKIETGVNEAEKDYYATRGEIDAIEKEAREVQRLREQCDLLLMEVQNKLNDTKLELTGVKERLSVEFNINLEELMQQPEAQEQEELPDPDELAPMVQKIRDKIERIGPINPMAMEAYEEIKQRHDFITEQKADLVTAKESLLTTIEEIDAVAKETFLGAFQNIKANFIHVFRSLFTEEDDCDLRLSDPDNPLESNIEIIAKPKGKRPLTINQLSGGEKTLTATLAAFCYIPA